MRVCLHCVNNQNERALALGVCVCIPDACLRRLPASTVCNMVVDVGASRTTVSRVCP